MREGGAITIGKIVMLFSRAGETTFKMAWATQIIY